jgi:hypothetical protein
VSDSFTSQPDLLCPACGYDLRGIGTARCPECGNEFDRDSLTQSSLPWTHRKTIGRYRAFWTTVRLATLHPARLGREMNCSPSFSDAVRFRRLVVLHAAVPVGLALTHACARHVERHLAGAWLWISSDLPGSIAQVLLLIVGWLCLMACLFAIAGVASYLFHPASLPVDQQNRAIALSYYMCAPMIFSAPTLGLAAGTFWAARWLSDHAQILLTGVVVVLGFAPLLMQLLLMIRSPVVLLREATHCGVGRQVALALLLPMAWGALGLFLLVVVPYAAVAIALMVLSLRP